MSEPCEEGCQCPRCIGPYAEYGCCPKYFECYECGNMFCIHGYLFDDQCKGHTVTVIPFVKLCPFCDCGDE